MKKGENLKRILTTSSLLALLACSTLQTGCATQSPRVTLGPIDETAKYSSNQSEIYDSDKTCRYVSLLKVEF